MSKPIIRIHNTLNSEVIDREMTDVEFAQYQADQAAEAARQSAAIAKEAVRKALLEKLGITAEEAQLLLGGK
jgi:phosphopantetheinyl transferase (holo-ACP synthase)